MPDWLQILLTIIIVIGFIVLLVVIGLKIYHNITKPGMCTFVSYSPASKMTATDSYTQTGYISCSGGGSAWTAGKITIFNQGPGDFYIGPITGQSDPHEIQAGKTYTYNMVGNTDPNIYYVTGTTPTTPTFTITVS